MKSVRHIMGLLSAIALLATVLVAPLANATASHTCCPPDMMGAMPHMMQMEAMSQDDSSPEQSEGPCDFSCCGVMASVAVANITGSAVDAWSEADAFRFPANTNALSALTSITTPPPKG